MNPKSNGLGLSICKNLSRRMNGDIGVLSDGKNGSTFRFTMQLKQIEQIANISSTQRQELRRRDLGVICSSSMVRQA